MRLFSKKRSPLLFTLFFACFLLPLFLAFPAGATENVVFVSSNGTGDGSSPDKPLKARTTGLVGQYQLRSYDSELYQAVYMLQKTGGTVVICGEYVLDGNNCSGTGSSVRDMNLPTTADNRITFTSVYNGVDYREKNGARLILKAPACLRLGGESVFENIDLCSVGADRIISCGGYPTLFDESVNVIPLSSDLKPISNPGAAAFPTLCAGDRYHNLTADTDLTLLGGTWNHVAGGCWGIGSSGYAALDGSSKLTIGGNAVVKGTVYGTSPDPYAVQSGDISVTLKDECTCGSVIVCGKAGMTDPNTRALVRIETNSFPKNFRISAYDETQSVRPYSVADLSGSDGDTASMAKNLLFFDEVILRPDQTESVSLAENPLQNAVLFADDPICGSGMVFKVTCGGKEETVSYENCSSLVRFSPERAENGAGEIMVFYGEKEVGSFPVTVLPRPKITLLGGSVRVGKEIQSIKLFAEVESLSGFGTESYGFRVFPSFAFDSFSSSALSSTGGGETILFEGDLFEKGNSFTGVFGNIPAEEYRKEFYVAAFYTFTHDGVKHTAFSEIRKMSVYSLAESAVSSCREQPEVKSLLRSMILDKADRNEKFTFRQSIVDARAAGMNEYMEKMADVKWVCSNSIDYSSAASYTASLSYQRNVTYKGIPYVTVSENNKVGYEQFFEEELEGGKRYTKAVDIRSLKGSLCSTAVFLAAVRFCNNFTAREYEQSLAFPPSGKMFVKVGSYPVDRLAMTTPQVIEGMAEQKKDRAEILYQTYAAAKPGDFLISEWFDADGGVTLGHIRMVAEKPILAYRTVGGDPNAINPSSSYLVVSEQHSSIDADTRSTWRIRYRYSFSELMQGSYLPVRLASLESSYFETPECVLTDAPTAFSIRNGLSGKIVSNYDVQRVRVKVTDDNNAVVFEETRYYYFRRKIDLRSFDAEKKIPALPSGSYQLTLSALCANRERDLGSLSFSK